MPSQVIIDFAPAVFVVLISCVYALDEMDADAQDLNNRSALIACTQAPFWFGLSIFVILQWPRVAKCFPPGTAAGLWSVTILAMPLQLCVAFYLANDPQGVRDQYEIYLRRRVLLPFGCLCLGWVHHSITQHCPRLCVASTYSVGVTFSLNPAHVYWLSGDVSVLFGLLLTPVPFVLGVLAHMCVCVPAHLRTSPQRPRSSTRRLRRTLLSNGM